MHMYIVASQYCMVTQMVDVTVYFLTVIVIVAIQLNVEKYFKKATRFILRRHKGCLNQGNSKSEYLSLETTHGKAEQLDNQCNQLSN